MTNEGVKILPIKIPNDLPASKILKDENIFSLAQRMLRTPINNALEQLSVVGAKDDGEGEDA